MSAKSDGDIPARFVRDVLALRLRCRAEKSIEVRGQGLQIYLHTLADQPSSVSERDGEWQIPLAPKAHVSVRAVVASLALSLLYMKMNVEMPHMNVEMCTASPHAPTNPKKSAVITVMW